LAQKTCRFSAAASGAQSSTKPAYCKHCAVFLPFRCGRSGRSSKSKLLKAESEERRAGRAQDRRRRVARRRKSIKMPVATPLPLTIPINLVNIYLSCLLPILCAVATRTPPLQKRPFRQSAAKTAPPKKRPPAAILPSEKARQNRGKVPRLPPSKKECHEFDVGAASLAPVARNGSALAAHL